MRIYHTTDPEKGKSINPHLTVEAEYGSVVVTGSIYTAAHHQPAGSPWAGDHVVPGGMPAPCLDENIPQLGETMRVLVSHVDLDTVGGVLRALPGTEELFAEDFGGFWELAGFVDVNGAHRLHEAPANSMNKERLYAWWAFAKTLPRLPFNELTDVTGMFEITCYSALRKILGCHPEMIEAGKNFRLQEDALNRKSFLKMEDGIIFRKAEKGEFVNHLYTSPEGTPAEGIVAFSEEFSSVTISLPLPREGVSCRDLVQARWGALAGGHPGIAGSPRGEQMSLADAEVIALDLKNALQAN